MFSTGFYFGKPTEESQIYDNSTYVNEYTYLGMIDRVAEAGTLPWQQVQGEEKLPGQQMAGTVGEQPSQQKTGMAEKQPQQQTSDVTGNLFCRKDLMPAEDTSLARFGQRNKFSVGETIEIMKPDGRNVTALVEALYDEAGEPVESCPHARQVLWVKLSEAAEPYNLFRCKVCQTTDL